MRRRERLRALIEQMRCSGIGRVLDEELDVAERQGSPVAEVVFRLLSAEDAARREKSLAYRLAQARLPWPWTLQSFPFAHQPSVNKAQVLSLAGLDFLRRGENLLLIGPPGTGKSGIAVGLLREACLNGYRARFFNAQALLDELYASLADRSTVGLLNQLCRLPLIAIDELGYLNLKPEQVNAFFRLMDQRYSLRLSTIITTNLAGSNAGMVAGRIACVCRRSSQRISTCPTGTSCFRRSRSSMRCSTACSIGAPSCA